jgi:hypothetical protein
LLIKNSKTFKKTEIIPLLMKKRFFVLSLLILLTACSSNIQELQEVNQTETTIILDDSELQKPYYNLTSGQIQEILGKSVTINKIYSTGEIDLTVDNTKTSIKETGSEEIINNLWITMISKSGILKETSVILKIEPVILDDNQYLLEKNVLTKIQGKWFSISESKSNGNIQLIVYNSQDSKSSESYGLKHGETININGLSVTNVRNFYKVNQYAILEIKY